MGKNLGGSIAIGTFSDVEELILNMREFFTEKADEQAEEIIKSFESRFPGISEAEFLDDDMEPYEGTVRSYLQNHDMSQFVDQGQSINYHILSYYFVFLIADRIYMYKKNKRSTVESDLKNAESRRKMKRDVLIEHISKKGISELELKQLQVLKKNQFSIQF